MARKGRAGAGLTRAGLLLLLSALLLSGYNLLDDRRAGDAVTFTDVEGNAFPYRVAEVQILRPTDTEAMLSPEWDLTLFTCTPGGRTRLAVRCVRDAP